MCPCSMTGCGRSSWWPVPTSRRRWWVYLCSIPRKHWRKWKAENMQSCSWSFLCNMFETLQDYIPKNQNCILCNLERSGTLHSWCGLINVCFMVATYNWETLSATELWEGFSCKPTSRPQCPFPLPTSKPTTSLAQTKKKSTWVQGGNIFLFMAFPQCS